MKPARPGAVDTKPMQAPARDGEIAPATLPYKLPGLQHESSAIGPDILATVVAALTTALIPHTQAFTEGRHKAQGEAPDLLTVGGAAALLRCSRETIRRKAESGELPCIVVSRGKRKKSRRFNGHMIHALAAYRGEEADLGVIARQWLAAQADGEGHLSDQPCANPEASSTRPYGIPQQPDHCEAYGRPSSSLTVKTLGSAGE
jgi:excisionase family DNA binding protein